ncbi:MAG: hypothetical protein MI922_27775 [Bacteroidales bacterium]|nr:hypothetical protein [Bacteroidales bacterium]
MLRTIFILTCISLCAFKIFAKDYIISSPQQIMIDYGIEILTKTMQQGGNTLKVQDLNKYRNADIIVLANKANAATIKQSNLYDEHLKNEGFKIVKQANKIIVAGADTKGAMYGLLELSEIMRLHGKLDRVKEITVSPRMEFRAIKFNLPYMSYRSDASLAQHFNTCRDLDFWEKYLDMMAKNRFNVLSLWSLHLYHYMVKPEKYPEATHFTDVELAEWKKFWTSLFQMAKQRGIDTYIVNWNTFVSPSFSRAHNVASYSQRPWHYGSGDTTKLVEDYTKEMIKTVINEYPDLTGLGITLGERMGGQSADERREWLNRTIFAGMKEANRKIKFIYRAPLSANKSSSGSTSEENDLKTRQQIESLDVDGPVWLEFKYNWSHGHSSPNLFIVHGGKLTDKYKNPVPEKYKYIWTVRNEDFFVHRWGQPGFVRSFIENNGHDYVGGCFIGSEVFIPALDYTSKQGPHKTWQYSFERLWLWYSVWGRLLYDENTPDEMFADLLENRYGKGTGKIALEAWKTSGDVLNIFTSFHQGRNDLTMYAEIFSGYQENGKFRFFDIDKFPNYRVLDTIRYINIANYIKNDKKAPRGIITPPELADSLDKIHNKSLLLLQELRKYELSPTTDCELTDIEAWAWYAKYVADKIRASLALSEYRINNVDKRDEAVAWLEKCVQHWQNYIDLTMKYNTEGFEFYTADNFSWNMMLDFVKKDIELARRSNEQKAIDDELERKREAEARAKRRKKH